MSNAFDRPVIIDDDFDYGEGAAVYVPIPCDERRHKAVLARDVQLCSPMSRDDMDYLAAFFGYEAMGKRAGSSMGKKEV